MPQVSQSAVLVSMKDADVLYSTDGSSFTSFCGYATSVEVGGGERESGEAYTFCGDTALIGLGKRAPIDVTFNIIYTEVNTDPFQVLRAAYENATPHYVRIEPKGGEAGEWLWTSSLGYWTRVNEPAGEANSGDPVAVEATFRAAYFAKTNAAS